MDKLIIKTVIADLELTLAWITNYVDSNTEGYQAEYTALASLITELKQTAE
jgi:hypothetical protein